MKFKALNFAILLTVGSGSPLATLADTTETPTTNAISQTIDFSQPKDEK